MQLRVVPRGAGWRHDNFLYGDDTSAATRRPTAPTGYDWRNGTTILLLTTTGRKSGKERTHALIYRDYDDKYLIVGVEGRLGRPADVVRCNIEADPNVQVQIKGDKFAARARVATPEEKPDMWKHMTEVWPDYDELPEEDRPRDPGRRPRTRLIELIDARLYACGERTH